MGGSDNSLHGGHACGRASGSCFGGCRRPRPADPVTVWGRKQSRPRRLAAGMRQPRHRQAAWRWRGCPWRVTARPSAWFAGPRDSFRLGWCHRRRPFGLVRDGGGRRPRSASWMRSSGPRQGSGGSCRGWRRPQTARQRSQSRSRGPGQRAGELDPGRSRLHPVLLRSPRRAGDQRRALRRHDPLQSWAARRGTGRRRDGSFSRCPACSESAAAPSSAAARAALPLMWRRPSSAFFVLGFSPGHAG